MFRGLIERVVIALASAIIFGGILTLFQLTSYDMKDFHVWSFVLEMMLVFLMFVLFSLPVYLTAGVISTMIIPKLFNKSLSKKQEYIKNLFFYILLGAVFGSLYMSYLIDGSFVINYDSLFNAGYGILASAIYYHLFLVREKMFKNYMG